MAFEFQWQTDQFSFGSVAAPVAKAKKKRKSPPVAAADEPAEVLEAFERACKKFKLFSEEEQTQREETVESILAKHQAPKLKSVLKSNKKKKGPKHNVTFVNFSDDETKKNSNGTASKLTGVQKVGDIVEAATTGIAKKKRKKKKTSKNEFEPESSEAASDANANNVSKKNVPKSTKANESRLVNGHSNLKLLNLDFKKESANSKVIGGPSTSTLKINNGNDAKDCKQSHSTHPSENDNSLSKASSKSNKKKKKKSGNLDKSMKSNEPVNSKKSNQSNKPAKPDNSSNSSKSNKKGEKSLLSDNDGEWEDVDDCSDSEIEFGSDEEEDIEALQNEVKAFMAGMDFAGARKLMEKSMKTEKNECNDEKDGYESDDEGDDGDQEDDNESDGEGRKEESSDGEDGYESDVEEGDEEENEKEGTMEYEDDSNEGSDVKVKQNEGATKDVSKLNKPALVINKALSDSIKASLSRFGPKADEASSAKSDSKKTTDTLAQKMRNQLNAAKFRMINEQLYTMPGSKAVKLFKSDPTAFDVYHEGFKSQVAQWPLNPLDVIVDWLKLQSKSWVVADFGCGEAELSERVAQKVHSFDLVAKKPQVVACNMAHVPLPPSSVHVAVFCLSLMGTNVNDFIAEANRTLKNGGILKIAEVKSRISNIEEFVSKIQKFGFKCSRKPVDHNYFIAVDFKKFRKVKNKESLPQLKLKPCLYKKR